MNVKKILLKLQETISIWESSLENYSEKQFSRNPDLSGGWSIGQVYEHLVNGTLRYHLKQIEQCLSNPLDEKGEKTTPGKIVYFLGGFLPRKIKVPPSPQYTPKQPENKDKIKESLKVLNSSVINAAEEIGKKQSGKIKHPALGYLDATEWFALINMHFRHHLRQKARLDKFIKN